MDSNKLRRFLAVSAMAVFLGASSAHAQLIPLDTDGDGFTDDIDECDNSIFTSVSPTVIINGVDTGIPNTEPNAVGCTLADLITDIVEDCAFDAKNHGEFVSCVSHGTNILKRARTISGKQKGKIQSIVARMR